MSGAGNYPFKFTQSLVNGVGNYPFKLSLPFAFAFAFAMFLWLRDHHGCMAHCAVVFNAIAQDGSLKNVHQHNL